MEAVVNLEQGDALVVELAPGRMTGRKKSGCSVWPRKHFSIARCGTVTVKREAAWYDEQSV